MAYYVTVKDRDRVGWLAGPYRRLGDAERAVFRASVKADDIDRGAAWYAFGTAHDRAGHSRVGILNDAMGLELDNDGFVVVADPPRLVIDHRTFLHGSGPAPRGYVKCPRRTRLTVCDEDPHFHPLIESEAT